jgi:hypothetical protein
VLTLLGIRQLVTGASAIFYYTNFGIGTSQFCLDLASPSCLDIARFCDTEYCDNLLDIQLGSDGEFTRQDILLLEFMEYRSVIWQDLDVFHDYVPENYLFESSNVCKHQQS